MENPVAIYENTLPELKCLLDEFPYFQTARLLYLKNLNNIKDSSFASELKKNAFYSADRKRLFYLLDGEQMEKIRRALTGNEHPAANESFDLIDIFLRSTGDMNDLPDYFSKKYMAYKLEEEVPKEEEKTPASEQENIIEQFLKKNEEHPFHSIMENSQPNDTVEHKHVDNDPEKSLTFSETLAKIYTQQRKYDKALEIIRKLNLLYPEKSVYFADQIQKLEKLIINAN
jgi:hypothetical protein